MAAKTSLTFWYKNNGAHSFGANPVIACISGTGKIGNEMRFGEGEGALVLTRAKNPDVFVWLDANVKHASMGRPEMPRPDAIGKAKS